MDPSANSTPRNRATPGRRLLLLCATTGYQTREFVGAANRLGLSVAFGSDRCHVLEDPWQDGALPLRFEKPEESARQIVEYARANPVDAIVAIGDRPTPTAARACEALGLYHHPPAAADACSNKYLSRQRLRAAGMNVPAFTRFPIETDPREILASGGPEVGFPCVLKPLALSASRGVIRADDPEQFIGAFERIRTLLSRPDVQVMREASSHFIQVESYVDGEEFAVEGAMDRGRLKVLAIFDKPDLLRGPYFEETLYVTPSRLGKEVQNQVEQTLEHATRALGLYHGPLHAELRVNPKGVWVLEVAARSIGGLCSRALRFVTPTVGEAVTLEELLIRLALGTDVETIHREPAASGVMMIPIPRAGVFKGIEGVEEALEVPGVEDVMITAKPMQELAPSPEGTSYLGFIFARGESPDFVEQGLRRAHRKLRFTVTPALPVL